ncbi:MAG: hypothetical protein GF355_13435 [Candidatus Eisenbacteria bacterium]|nr:hypothetical protein [Candidatus Eisenbacteria bacterium]
MKKLLLGVAVLALSAGVASAGPNEGVQLHVHGNVDGVDTGGTPCETIVLPATCEELNPTATEAPDGLYWFLAVVVSPPENPVNFNTVVFGVENYDYTTSMYIGQYGPCVEGSLEIPTETWPQPTEFGLGSGTAVTWAPNCLEGHLEPVYYFGCYYYGPDPLPLGEHPVQPASVVDCSAESVEDALVAFGELNGVNPPCPEGGVGACCIEGECVYLSQADCVGQGGYFAGGNCEDVDCSSIAVETTTWGKIKQTYR